jgi:hypothetical protein
MKSLRTAAAVAVAGTMLATGSLALAAGGSTHPTTGTPSHGGPIKIFVTNETQTKAKILITGVVGDYGTIITTNKSGKVDANGVYQHAHLKHGTLLINSTGLSKALDKARPNINPDTCSVDVSATGASKILSGTGLYAGATGSVNITATFAGIAPKEKSGKCNLSNNAPFFGLYQSIVGSGSITIS